MNLFHPGWKQVTRDQIPVHPIADHLLCKGAIPGQDRQAVPVGGTYSATILPRVFASVIDDLSCSFSASDDNIIIEKQ